MKDKKKIYFLVNSLEWGWAERVIINISEKLSEYFDIDIITLKDSKFYELPNWINHISLLNIKNNLLMFLMIPYYIYKFRRLLKISNYYNWVSFLEIANFVNILSNKKAIISFRINIIFFIWIIWNIYKIFIIFFYPKSYKIIVNSEENRYDISEYLSLDINKIITIYNPINLSIIDNLKNKQINEFNIENFKNKKVFITIWRLVRQKNHNKIINSFRYIYDNIDKSWIYLIVWDWPEYDNLKKLVLDYKLENNIIFLWSQKNVFKFLNISDYFVYASEVEWFPNVLIEAMGCWLPIITSDFKTGAKEIVLWKYEKKTWNDLKYPYCWPNWVLLDLNNFEAQFIELYKLWKFEKLNKDYSSILKKFDIDNIKDQWVDVLERE
jgi:glycosyltransferase involved in cell wall biosynthesis